MDGIIFSFLHDTCKNENNIVAESLFPLRSNIVPILGFRGLANNCSAAQTRYPLPSPPFLDLISKDEAN